MTITVRDLQGKNVTTHAETTIRKAWVLQAPESMKAKFKAVIPEVRFAMYKEIDSDVRDAWITELRLYRESLEAKGIFPILDPITGVSSLPEEHQIETEELLIVAARKVIDKMMKAEAK